MTVTQDVERRRGVAAGIDVIIDLTARRLAFEMDAGGVLRGVFAAALLRVGDTRHFALSVFGKVKNNGVAASGKNALRKDVTPPSAVGLLSAKNGTQDGTPVT